MEALKDRNHLIKTKPNNAINIILQKCVFGVLCVTLLLRTDNRGSKCWRLCVMSSSTFAFPIVLARRPGSDKIRVSCDFRLLDGTIPVRV
jgi:hypothetical protein